MKIVDTVNSGAFNQISILCVNFKRLCATRESWKALGYRQWTMDYCVQTAPLNQEQTVTAILAFNFDIIPGFQYELLCWDPSISYPNPMGNGYVSHMAFYTQDVEADVVDIQDYFGVEPWYKFVTLDHSNPALQGKTRFKEAVWNIPDINMSIKAVQKIPWDSSEAWK